MRGGLTCFPGDECPSAVSVGGLLRRASDGQDGAHHLHRHRQSLTDCVLPRGTAEDDTAMDGKQFAHCGTNAWLVSVMISFFSC